MKKILLLTIITAGTILSATAFAGQGFDVQVINNQSYPIQYKEIDELNWNNYDITNTWITIAPHSTSYKYTESKGFQFLDGTSGENYITVIVESTTGTVIGCFAITDLTNMDPSDWPGQQVVVNRFGPNSGDKWNSLAVEIPNEPSIFFNINDTQKQDNVNISVGNSTQTN
ncbi:MAG: hypothetical protein NTX05_08735 [Fusobacteria bacterium]|nr:hypothetical protein [Fusobacteriota bacterium]